MLYLSIKLRENGNPFISLMNSLNILLISYLGPTIWNPILGDKTSKLEFVMRKKDKSGVKEDEALNIESVHLIGPTEASRIIGWKHRSSFYKHFHEGRFPGIRSVSLLKGRYYVLEDVFGTAFPEASDERLRELIIEYRAKRGQKVKKIYGSKQYLEDKIGSPLSRFS